MNLPTQQFHTSRKATEAELASQQAKYFEAKHQLEQKLKQALSILATDQPIQGDQRKELQQLLQDAGSTAFNAMDLQSYNYFELQTVGVVEKNA